MKNFLLQRHVCGDRPGIRCCAQEHKFQPGMLRRSRNFAQSAQLCMDYKLRSLLLRQCPENTKHTSDSLLLKKCQLRRFRMHCCPGLQHESLPCMLCRSCCQQPTWYQGHKQSKTDASPRVCLPGKPSKLQNLLSRQPFQLGNSHTGYHSAKQRFLARVRGKYLPQSTCNLDGKDDTVHHSLPCQQGSCLLGSSVYLLHQRLQNVLRNSCRSRCRWP